jgi:hypothetical protein
MPTVISFGKQGQYQLLKPLPAILSANEAAALAPFHHKKIKTELKRIGIHTIGFSNLGYCKKQKTRRPDRHPDFISGSFLV